MYAQINEKFLRVPIIHFFVLVRFNIWRHCFYILSVVVSESVHTANCTRKCRTNITCHNLHNYTPALFTSHHTLLYTHMIQHTKKFPCHLFSCTRNYCTRENITIYTTTHMHTSHIIIHLYIWKNICTGLSRLKNRLHQVLSPSPLV